MPVPKPNCDCNHDNRGLVHLSLQGQTSYKVVQDLLYELGKAQCFLDEVNKKLEVIQD